MGSKSYRSELLNSRRFLAFLMIVAMFLMGAQMGGQSIADLYRGVFLLLMTGVAYELVHQMVMAMIRYKKGDRK